MARVARGGAFASRGRVFMRVTIAAGQRRAEALPWVTAEQWASHAAGDDCACVACVRARQVQAWITAIREAGKADDFAENVIRVAATADAAKMRELAKAVGGIVGGTIKPKRPAVAAKDGDVEGWVPSGGEPAVREPRIYIAGVPSRSLVKIGRTGQPLESRMIELRTRHKMRVELIGSRPGGRQEERFYQMRFGHYWCNDPALGTEWFWAVGDLARLVSALAPKLRWAL